MTPNELAEGAIFETGLNHIDTDMRLKDTHEILEICGSLVTYDEVSNQVRLAHHSVREYLSSQVPTDSPFFMPGEASHREVSELCLSYLLLDDFSCGWTNECVLREKLWRFPLLRYAAEWWPYHVIDSKAEQALQPLILRIMDPAGVPPFTFWLQVVTSSWGGTDFRKKPDWDPKPLYYAASYGLEQTARSLVTLGAGLDDKAGRFGGTALHAAVFRAHPRLVRLLLDSGADPTIHDNNGTPPSDFCTIYAYANNGGGGGGGDDSGTNQREIVRLFQEMVGLLLDRPANQDSRPGRSAPPQKRPLPRINE